MTHSMAELDLIVGVMSYGPQHARRQGMRDMCNCSWPGIALRFVMAIGGKGNGSVAEDAAAGDCSSSTCRTTIGSWGPTC